MLQGGERRRWLDVPMHEQSPEADEVGDPPIEDVAGLVTLLEHLRATRGFDFTGYRQASLARRIGRRMQVVGCASHHDYLDFLQVHPEELAQLLDAVLVNVTSFFRDATAWDALRVHVAQLAASRPPGSPIRGWSAGCASGEEAYSLAILLAECVGLAELGRRVKIYATDVDDAALAEARAATYTAKAVEGVPPALLARYFTPTDRGYVVSRELRRAVVFGRHDLLRDAPISRIDVLVCRNALIYFDAETQKKLLSRLHVALAPEGILFLGKTEMLLAHGAPFTPLDLRQRIFASTADSGRRLRSPSFRDGRRSGGAPPVPAIVEAAFDALPHAVIALDAPGRVARINQRAAHAFGLGPGDLGRPFQDLELSYRPTELRSVIDRVRAERRVVRIDGIERTSDAGHVTSMDLEVVPLIERDEVVGVELCFRDSTPMRRMEAELRAVNRELSASHHALESANEELATTNEELQSTNEQLNATNDELHATNDELKTLNDELQSTNTELVALNDDLAARGRALDQANLYLTTILGSLRSGVAVLDGDLVVRSWNQAMTDLCGVPSTDVVGEPFLALAIGLPVAELEGTLRAALAGAIPGDDLVARCASRRGCDVEVRISVRALRSETEKGVLVLLEETR